MEEEVTQPRYRLSPAVSHTCLGLAALVVGFVVGRFSSSPVTEVGLVSQPTVVVSQAKYPTTISPTLIPTVTPLPPRTFVYTEADHLSDLRKIGRAWFGSIASLAIDNANQDFFFRQPLAGKKLEIRRSVSKDFSLGSTPDLGGPPLEFQGAGWRFQKDIAADGPRDRIWAWQRDRDGYTQFAIFSFVFEHAQFDPVDPPSPICPCWDNRSILLSDWVDAKQYIR